MKIYSQRGVSGVPTGNEGLQSFSGAHGVWRTELGGMGITRLLLLFFMKELLP